MLNLARNAIRENTLIFFDQIICLIQIIFNNENFPKYSILPIFNCFSRLPFINYFKNFTLTIQYIGENFSTYSQVSNNNN